MEGQLCVFLAWSYSHPMCSDHNFTPKSTHAEYVTVEHYVNVIL